MRAYRKTTHHPFCIYLTAEEAVDVASDIDDAISSITEYDATFPVLNALGAKLNHLLADPKRERS